MIEPHDIDVTIRRQKWRIRFVDPDKLTDANGSPLAGLCDPPEYERRFIRVAANLRGRDLLETVIHELLHACLWDTCEEAIDETARDVARILTRLRPANG